MSDRELLEMAAKACGWICDWVENLDDGTSSLRVFYGLNPSKVSVYDNMDWNPLTDDGDALRLAGKLSLGIIFDYQPVFRTSDLIGKSFRVRVWCIGGWMKEEFNTEEEKSIAVRMCIVRAAAEIGRAMQ